MPLAELPFEQLFNDDGNPLSGAVIRFYEVSSLIPKTIYSDINQSVSLGSYVVANSNGRFDNIYVNYPYKIRVEKSITDGTLIDEIDNIGKAISDINTNLETLITASDVQNSVMNFVTSTGSGNNYILTPTPPITSYVAGTSIKFKANFTNTGASTINISNVGVFDLKTKRGNPLPGAYILGGATYEAFFDGSSFRVGNPDGQIQDEQIVKKKGSGYKLLDDNASTPILAICYIEGQRASTPSLSAISLYSIGYTSSSHDRLVYENKFGDNDFLCPAGKANYYNQPIYTFGTSPATNTLAANLNLQSYSGGPGSECNANSVLTRIHHYFTNPNGIVGSITTNGSTTSYNTTSDPRLKSEFESVTPNEVWEKLDSIIGTIGKFNFLNDEQEKFIGFNAHALIDRGIGNGIANEGVGGRDAAIGVNAETGGIVTPASVDASKMIAILCLAIKDLKTTVEGMQNA